MRIAIVAPKSWFTSNTVGGSEKQIYYIAISLVRAGHNVDLFTMDVDDTVMREGVKVIPAWNPNKGIPKLRYLFYRLPLLKKFILYGNYNLVYVRGQSHFSSTVVKAARKAKAISVIGIAADSSLSWEKWKESFPEGNRVRHLANWLLLKYFHEFSLKRAHVVAVQNKEQARYAKWFSTNIVYCPNVISCNYCDENMDHMKSTDVIWIGAFRPEKGIESLFYVIDSLPQVNFTVIGQTVGIRQSNIANKLNQKSNVRYIRHVDNCCIHNLLRSSKLLLNTSPHEGFSNTFLEAWLAGIPVVSLHVNPSNLLSNRKLGYCANSNIDDLAKAIVDIVYNNTHNFFSSDYAKDYVCKFHSPQKVVELFEKIEAAVHVN